MDSSNEISIDCLTDKELLAAISNISSRIDLSELSQVERYIISVFKNSSNYGRTRDAFRYSNLASTFRSLDRPVKCINMLLFTGRGSTYWHAGIFCRFALTYKNKRVDKICMSREFKYIDKSKFYRVKDELKKFYTHKYDELIDSYTYEDFYHYTDDGHVP